MCTIRRFKVKKSPLYGIWKEGTEDINVKIKNLIGSGGMKHCFSVQIDKLPPEFSAPSPFGWVAKFYIHERKPDETWSLYSKVSIHQQFLIATKENIIKWSLLGKTAVHLLDKTTANEAD